MLVTIHWTPRLLALLFAVVLMLGAVGCTSEEGAREDTGDQPSPQTTAETSDATSNGDGDESRGSGDSGSESAEPETRQQQPATGGGQQRGSSEPAAEDRARGGEEARQEEALSGGPSAAERDSAGEGLTSYGTVHTVINVVDGNVRRISGAE